MLPACVNISPFLIALLSCSLEAQGGPEAKQYRTGAIRQITHFLKPKLYAFCFIYLFIYYYISFQTAEASGGTSPFLQGFCLPPCTEAKPIGVWRMDVTNSGISFPGLSALLWLSEGLVFPTVLG